MRTWIFIVIIIAIVIASFSLGFRSRENRYERQQNLTQATSGLCVYIATFNVYLSDLERINRDRMRELPRGTEKAYIQEIVNTMRQARQSFIDVSASCREVEG